MQHKAGVIFDKEKIMNVLRMHGNTALKAIWETVAGEIEGVKVCPYCQRENRGHALRCWKCGKIIFGGDRR